MKEKHVTLRIMTNVDQSITSEDATDAWDTGMKKVRNLKNGK